MYKSEREELRVSATGEASGEGRNLSASPRPCLLSLPVLQQPWGRTSQEELRPTAADLGSEVSKCRKHSGVGVQAQPPLQKIIIFKKWIKNCCEGAKRDFFSWPSCYFCGNPAVLFPEGSVSVTQVFGVFGDTLTTSLSSPAEESNAALTTKPRRPWSLSETKEKDCERRWCQIMLPFSRNFAPLAFPGSTCCVRLLASSSEPLW